MFTRRVVRLAAAIPVTDVKGPGNPMSANLKIVVRFNLRHDPAMEERYAREADIELRTCDLKGPEAGAWSALGTAHARPSTPSQPRTTLP